MLGVRGDNLQGYLSSESPVPGRARADAVGERADRLMFPHRPDRVSRQELPDLSLRRRALQLSLPTTSYFPHCILSARLGESLISGFQLISLGPDNGK